MENKKTIIVPPKKSDEFQKGKPLILNQETIKSKDHKNLIKTIIKEVEEDEDNNFAPNLDNYDKITLTDQYLPTDSSKSKDEKEEDKEKRVTSVAHHSKSLIVGDISSKINVHHTNNKKNSENDTITTSGKGRLKSLNFDENKFSHKLVNEETVTAKKDRSSKIYRAKKKNVDKLITNDNKANEAEA